MSFYFKSNPFQTNILVLGWSFLFFIFYNICRVIGQAAYNGKHKWIVSNTASGGWNSFRSIEDQLVLQAFSFFFLFKFFFLTSKYVNIKNYWVNLLKKQNATKLFYLFRSYHLIIIFFILYQPIYKKIHLYWHCCSKYTN